MTKFQGRCSKRHLNKLILDLYFPFLERDLYFLPLMLLLRRRLIDNKLTVLLQRVRYNEELMPFLKQFQSLMNKYASKSMNKEARKSYTILHNLFLHNNLVTRKWRSTRNSNSFLSLRRSLCHFKVVPPPMHCP